jgi:hypothetical protein
MQEIRYAFCLALARAGKSSAAKMAIMAITTSSSIRVKARLNRTDGCLEKTLVLGTPFSIVWVDPLKTAATSLPHTLCCVFERIGDTIKAITRQLYTTNSFHLYGVFPVVTAIYTVSDRLFSLWSGIKPLLMDYFTDFHFFYM